MLAQVDRIAPDTAQNSRSLVRLQVVFAILDHPVQLLKGGHDFAKGGIEHAFASVSHAHLRYLFLVVDDPLRETPQHLTPLNERSAAPTF